MCTLNLISLHSVTDGNYGRFSEGWVTCGTVGKSKKLYKPDVGYKVLLNDISCHRWIFCWLYLCCRWHRRISKSKCHSGTRTSCGGARIRYTSCDCHQFTLDMWPGRFWVTTQTRLKCRRGNVTTPTCYASISKDPDQRQVVKKSCKGRYLSMMVPVAFTLSSSVLCTRCPLARHESIIRKGAYIDIDVGND